MARIPDGMIQVEMVGARRTPEWLLKLASVGLVINIATGLLWGFAGQYARGAYFIALAVLIAVVFRVRL